MSTSTNKRSLSDILRVVESGIREATDTMQFGHGLPVTTLEGWEIERCYDALSNSLNHLQDARLLALLGDLASELLATVKEAVYALNTAPRFRVPGLDTDGCRMDSYRIAARCDRVLARARGLGL